VQTAPPYGKIGTSGRKMIAQYAIIALMIIKQFVNQVLNSLTSFLIVKTNLPTSNISLNQIQKKENTQMSTRLIYVVSRRRRNPVTVAYRATETTNDGRSEIEIDFGAAFCSNGDRFNRVLGRRIAEGRLNTRPITRRIPYTPGTSFSYAVSSYIRNTILNENTKISSIYSRTANQDVSDSQDEEFLNSLNNVLSSITGGQTRFSLVGPSSK
jgi:hypothetical protein